MDKKKKAVAFVDRSAMTKEMASVNKSQEATGNGRFGTGNTGPTATKWLGSAAAPILGNHADPPVLGLVTEPVDSDVPGSTVMEDLRKAGNRALLAAGMLVRTVESTLDLRMEGQETNNFKKKWEKKKAHTTCLYIGIPEKANRPQLSAYSQHTTYACTQHTHIYTTTHYTTYILSIN